MLAPLIRILKQFFLKIFVKNVTFGGKPTQIAQQLKKWKKDNKIFLIHTYRFLGTPRKMSFDNYWYVKDNWLMRYCGLDQYKDKRTYLNGTGSKDKRKAA